LKGRKTVVSRKVFAGKNDRSELRPTSAKVREALFDILRNDIGNASFLDLYAGTGTIGLEALSRGAARALLVENDSVRCRAIQDFIDRTGLAGKAVVYKQPAAEFLKRTSLPGSSFDIVFADPPYASPETAEIPHLVGGSDILKQGGCLVIEHSSKAEMPAEAGLLQLVKKYRYGDTMLSLYRKGK